MCMLVRGPVLFHVFSVHPRIYGWFLAPLSLASSTRGLESRHKCVVCVCVCARASCVCECIHHNQGGNAQGPEARTSHFSRIFQQCDHSRAELSFKLRISAGYEPWTIVKRVIHAACSGTTSRLKSAHPSAVSCRDSPPWLLTLHRNVAVPQLNHPSDIWNWRPTDHSGTRMVCFFVLHRGPPCMYLCMYHLPKWHMMVHLKLHPCLSFTSLFVHHRFTWHPSPFLFWHK